jgi:uncharacterized membrane protein
MCNMQAGSWGLHPVLQLLYLLSCNVCVKSRISHGGRLLFVVAIMIILLCLHIHFFISTCTIFLYEKQKCILSAISNVLLEISYLSYTTYQPDILGCHAVLLWISKFYHRLCLSYLLEKFSFVANLFASLLKYLHWS